MDGWIERCGIWEVRERGQRKLLQGQSHLVLFWPPGTVFVCVCCVVMPPVCPLLRNISGRHVSGAALTLFCGWVWISLCTFNHDSVKTFTGAWWCVLVSLMHAQRRDDFLVQWILKHLVAHSFSSYSLSRVGLQKHCGYMKPQTFYSFIFLILLPFYCNWERLVPLALHSWSLLTLLLTFRPPLLPHKPQQGHDEETLLLVFDGAPQLWVVLCIICKLVTVVPDLILN